MAHQLSWPYMDLGRLNSGLRYCFSGSSLGLWTEPLDQQRCSSIDYGWHSASYQDPRYIYGTTMLRTTAKPQSRISAVTRNFCSFIFIFRSISRNNQSEMISDYTDNLHASVNKKSSVLHFGFPFLVFMLLSTEQRYVSPSLHTRRFCILIVYACTLNIYVIPSSFHHIWFESFLFPQLSSQAPNFQY